MRALGARDPQFKSGHPDQTRHCEFCGQFVYSLASFLVVVFEWKIIRKIFRHPPPPDGRANKKGV
jgi:hypothetical protein